MEFNNKLQKLRKEKGLTQEQLAEALFVSRTAISKWESGKGYPNIDSLKSLSKLFSVSIDDLLSGEELISLTESENNLNMNKLFSLIYGILDIMVIVLLFLPLYGQADGTTIRMVSLFGFNDITMATRIIYFGLPLLIVPWGIVELGIYYRGSVKWLNRSRVISLLLNAAVILIFIGTRQPYAIALLFMFFMIKIILLIKHNNFK